MISRRVLAFLVLSSMVGPALGGCAPKTASTLTEKDRVTFKGGPMPTSAKQQMAEWIKKSQDNETKTGNGPTAAETAAMK